MWVRVPDWLLADDEPPRPAPGDVLHQVGIRIPGRLHPAREGQPDQIMPVPHPITAAPAVAYALTGTVAHPRDLWEAMPHRWWPHRTVTTRHLGTRLTLTVDGQQYWADVPGPARALTEGARVTVTDHPLSSAGTSGSPTTPTTSGPTGRPGTSTTCPAGTSSST